MPDGPSRRQWLLALLTGCFGLLPRPGRAAVPPKPLPPDRLVLPEIAMGTFTYDPRQPLTIYPAGSLMTFVYDARGNFLFRTGGPPAPGPA